MAPASPDQIAAARGMELMMVEQMIQEMRKTVPENELLPKTQSERIFEQMLDQEYARKITEAYPLGIADLVLAELRGQR